MSVNLISDNSDIKGKLNVSIIVKINKNPEFHLLSLQQIYLRYQTDKLLTLRRVQYTNILPEFDLFLRSRFPVNLTLLTLYIKVLLMINLFRALAISQSRMFSV